MSSIRHTPTLHGASLFIIVLSAVFAGQLRAADQVTSPPVMQGDIGAIVVDSNGNRYYTGSFTGSRDFNPDVGEDTKTTAGSDRDVFVTRINADGSYGWTQVFGGTADDEGVGIAVDELNGLVLIAGDFSSADAKIGGAGVGAASAGGKDAFIIELDASTGAAKAGYGNGNGIQTFGGSGEDAATGLAISANIVYVSGYFTSDDAGFGGTGAYDNNGVVADSFVIALNTTTGVNVPSFGNAGVYSTDTPDPDFAYGIVLTPLYIYICGTTGEDVLPGNTDGYVLSLNKSSGLKNFTFGASAVQVIGGAGNDGAFDLTLSDDVIFVTGWFTSSDLGIGGAGTFSASGAEDVYLAALDATTGSALDYFGDGGMVTMGSTGSDIGRAVTTGDGTVYVAGDFQNTVMTSGGLSETAIGVTDAFVLALDEVIGSEELAFSGNGIEIFGGSATAVITGLDTYNGTLYAAGGFTGSGYGIGAPGSISATGFNGFSLELTMLAPLVVVAEPDKTGTIDQRVTVTASFTPVNLGDSHVATIDWGDGSTSQGTVDEINLSVTGSHIYSTRSTYPVIITVSNQNHEDGSDRMQLDIIAYYITSTINSNGTITPLGVIAKQLGDSQTYTYTADTGYFIETVEIDGASVPIYDDQSDSYTFVNIIDDHTIAVTCTLRTFTIYPSGDSNGTITPAVQMVFDYGASQTYTITPMSGYLIDDVTVDDVSVGPVPTYTFDSITADHTIHATFKVENADSRTLTATAGVNGRIDPSGTLVVNSRDDLTFTITPDTGYLIDDVTVDGASVGPVPAYDFTYILDDHVIHATFKIKSGTTRTVTATAGPNGGIFPYGTLHVNDGDDLTFHIVPDTGYQIAQLLVDAVPINISSTVVLTSITSNHTVSVSFADITTKGGGGCALNNTGPVFGSSPVGIALLWMAFAWGVSRRRERDVAASKPM